MVQNRTDILNKKAQSSNEFTLKNGRPVTIRSIRPDDADRLVQLFNKLSERCKRLRFHASVDHLSPQQIQKEAENLANINPQQDAALAGTLEENGTEQIVAVVRFSRANPSDPVAEIAMVVRDDLQQQGLGTYLTQKITQMARSMGVQKFVASIIPENHPVVRVFEKLGLPTHQDRFMGETQLTVDIKPTKNEGDKK